MSTTELSHEILGDLTPVRQDGPNTGPFGGYVITAVSARSAFRPKADDLARQLFGAVEPFMRGHRLTAMAEWFHTPDDAHLIVVSGGHEQTDSMDEVLGYALAWQCDRDLTLVLPETHASQTLSRLAWVDTPVRVFVHGSGELRPAVIPSRSEVLAAAAARPLRRMNEHHLGKAADSVAALTTWATSNTSLVEVSRPSYCAWHCAGRQVLNVCRSGGGVMIRAGVDYSQSPPEGEEACLTIMVGAGETLTAADLAHIQYRVAKAIWMRLSSKDRGHVEHRLQASLMAGHLVKTFGLSEMPAREFPAWRGEDRPGFLDFLGQDKEGRLHVIETKVDPDDVAVVVQTLDYANWVTANADAIRTRLGWPPPTGYDKGVVCDFIFSPRARLGREDTRGPSGKAIGSYLAGQFEAISPDVSWTISLVSDPLAESPEIRRLPRHHFPTGDPLVALPVQPPRWAARVGTDLSEGS
jgi:hypothetical protein